MQSVLEGIRKESTDLSVAHSMLPMWGNEGLADYSCTIHSSGITHWNLIGRELGFVAIGELPAPATGSYAFVGGDVRTDSVWFDRETHVPETLIEFERYSSIGDEAKLVGKVESLVLAFHRWERKPKFLILAYWTKGHLEIPKHDLLKKHVRGGFETTAKERVEGATGCQLLFFQTMLTETDDNRWRLTQMMERGV